MDTPIWANWKAVCADGRVMYFRDMPVLREYGWIPRGPVAEYGTFGKEAVPDKPYCERVLNAQGNKPPLLAND